MKHVPNALSGLRCALSLALLYVPPLSPAFFAIYLACGVSDVLDGFIARRFNCASKLGATLDGIADVVFVGVLIVVFVRIVNLPSWMYFWVLGIALVRILSWLIGFAKFRAFASLHTHANKVTGIALFCAPLIHSLVGATAMAWLICSIASVSAVEEIAITVTSNELALNRPSFFRKGERPSPPEN